MRKLCLILAVILVMPSLLSAGFMLVWSPTDFTQPIDYDHIIVLPFLLDPSATTPQPEGVAVITVNNFDHLAATQNSFPIPGMIFCPASDMNIDITNNPFIGKFETTYLLPSNFDPKTFNTGSYIFVNDTFAVPEPASIALLALGGLMIRKRKSKLTRKGN